MAIPSIAYMGVRGGPLEQQLLLPRNMAVDRMGYDECWCSSNIKGKYPRNSKSR